MVSIELLFTNHGPDDVADIKIGSKVRSILLFFNALQSAQLKLNHINYPELY